ncbi:MAG: DUF1648 domain-containing protein [bacterium]|nr:DUF1648 domain-containing protein [bacterium]
MPASLLAIIWIVAITQYSSLPDALPVSFHFGGTPGDWAPKGWDFFVLPCTGLVVYILLTMVQALSARKVVVGGRVLHGKAAYHVNKAASNFLFLMKSALLAFLLNVEFRTIQIAYGRMDSLGWDSYIVAGLLLIYATLGSVMLYRLSRRWLRWQEEQDGDDEVCDGCCS